MTTIATLRVANPAPVSRPDLVAYRTVVPFRQGVIAPDAPLRTNGGGADIQRFGALWPDGSLRTALVQGWIDVPAASRVDLQVEEGIAGQTKIHPFGKPIPVPFLRGMRPEGALLEMADGHRVFRGRWPDGELWYQLEVWPALDGSHAFWFLQVGWSNPLNPDKQWTMPYPLQLVSPPGSALSCYWSSQFGVARRIVGDSTVLDLLPQGTVWGDGQMLAWRGSMVFQPTLSAQAALTHPLYAMATNWRDSGAWTPFGKVPQLPRWMLNEQAMTDWAHRNIRARDNSPRMDPWGEQRYGCRKVPGSTGDQQDFGVMQCWPVLASADPTVLDLYLEDVVREGCRPVHFVEADASIVRAVDHPELRMWDRAPHFDVTVCPDRLGKVPITMPMDVAAETLEGSPYRRAGTVDPDLRTLDEAERLFVESQFRAPSAAMETHGWWGHDDQHYSLNELLCTYQLTGDPQLGLLVEHLAEGFLSGQNTAPPLRPGFPTSGPNAPRAQGRTSLTGSQAHLVTDREDLRQRLVDRVDRAFVPGWFGQPFVPPLARPLQVTTTDDRQSPIPIGSLAWFPWQEAIAVTGFEAIFLVTGHQPARDLAKEIARTVVQYGWQALQIANCVVWNNGQDVDRLDPLKFMRADGTDFYLWAGACVRLALRDYGFDSDALILWDSIVNRADVPPSDFGPSRFEQWTAV